MNSGIVSKDGSIRNSVARNCMLRLNESLDTGLLLGASGNQILLDGVPLGAERRKKVSRKLLTSFRNRQYSLRA